MFEEGGAGGKLALLLLARLITHSLTVGSDLPASPVRGHPRLRRALVGPVLQPDHALPSLQLLLVEVALVLGRHFYAQLRTGEPELLGLEVVQEIMMKLSWYIQETARGWWWSFLLLLVVA